MRVIIVQNMFIYLISDGYGIILNAKPGDEAKFLFTEYFSGRVIGGINDDRLGFLVENIFKFVKVKGPVRRS